MICTVQADRRNPVPLFQNETLTNSDPSRRQIIGLVDLALVYSGSSGM